MEATVTALQNATLTTNGETKETVDFSAQVANHPLAQAAAWLYRLRLFFIFIPGAFGNVVILVLQRRIAGQLKDTVLPVFTSALAVSDLIMLTCLSWIYGLYYYGIDLFSMHEIPCRFLFFLLFVCANTSSWFLVSMTTHRAVTSCV